ncbi:IS5 family transposase [Streptomyces chartreusis]
MLDELWSLIEPLPPEPPPKPVEGRPRVPDRQALCGILFVLLHTGIPWEYPPPGARFSARACWRRLAARNEASVWDQLHQVLLNKLRSKDQLDWSRAVIVSSHVRTARRGPRADPAWSTVHVRAANTSITDDQGIPLAVSLTGGTRNDVPQLLPLLNKIPAVEGVVGRPGRRPAMLFADRGYDHDKHRGLLREPGSGPPSLSRDNRTALGTFRCVVERTISWLHGFRRLRIRWERRQDFHVAFLGLAVCLTTHRHVQRLCWGQLATSSVRVPRRARPGRPLVHIPSLPELSTRGRPPGNARSQTGQAAGQSRSADLVRRFSLNSSGKPRAGGTMATRSQARRDATEGCRFESCRVHSRPETLWSDLPPLGISTPVRIRVLSWFFSLFWRGGDY